MKTKLGLLVILFIGLIAHSADIKIYTNTCPSWFGIVCDGMADGFSQSTCLQTNVAESFTDPKKYNYAPWGAPPDKSEKWVTTTISKKTSLEFDWNGQHRIVSDITGISTNTVHLKIKQDWEEVK